MRFDDVIRSVLILLSVLFVLVLLHYGTPYDSTDANGNRSGLVLYTDYGTGCQYIRASWSSNIIKRVDKDGNHIGCK